MKNYFKAFTIAPTGFAGHTEITAVIYVPFFDDRPRDVAGAYSQTLAWASRHTGARVAVYKRPAMSGAWDNVELVGGTPLAVEAPQERLGEWRDNAHYEAHTSEAAKG